MSRCPIEDFLDEVVDWGAWVWVEFVGGSVGEKGAEAVGFVAEEVGEGVDAGGFHLEIGDVEFAQLCFIEVL